MPIGERDEARKLDRVNRVLSPLAQLFDSTRSIIIGIVFLVAGVGVAIAWLLGVFGVGDESSTTATTRVTVAPLTAPLTLTSSKSDGTLTVSVGMFSQDPTDQRAGELFLLPAGSPDATDMPKELNSAADWLVERGAIPAGSRSLSVILSSAKPVVIRAITPAIVERSKPTPGDLLRNAYGCGVAPVRNVMFELDADPPRVTYTSGEGPEEQSNLILTVDQTTREVIAVTAKSETDEVAWALQVDYEADGQLRTMTVDHNGEPFVVAGLAPGQPVYDYQYPTGAERRPELDSQPDSFC